MCCVWVQLVCECGRVLTLLALWMSNLLCVVAVIVEKFESIVQLLNYVHVAIMTITIMTTMTMTMTTMTTMTMTTMTMTTMTTIRNSQ